MEFTELMARAGGHVEARIIQTAVELAIFDALENSARSAKDIAGELKLEPKATASLLNALAALKLLNKQAEAFSLSDAATKYLLRRSPQYLGGMIRFEASLWNAWRKLPEAIRSGQPVRPPNMYQDDPAETETFIDAMDSLVNARGDTEMLADALDWHEVGDLLDVGSGPATYPIALCRRFSHLRATVFDLPATLK
ncbi:MAG: methyltransferase family protein, partial [Candidatus Binatia bacterium]